ncbi:hypothetical protein [Povalibacter sp.]|uniref:hypothetical protein n=1 Tax=Povalibacter sp. TaxID=1962978 RepID=UPI002F3E9105
MIWSRRDVVVSTASALALGMSTRPALAANAPWRAYGAAIVIDGLGGPGSLTAEPGAPLTPAHLEDTRKSGLTCAATRAQRRTHREDSCGEPAARVRRYLESVSRP